MRRYTVAATDGHSTHVAGAYHELVVQRVRKDRP